MAGEVGGGPSAAEMGLNTDGTPLETATGNDSIAVQGREFNRGDRVMIRRGLSDGRPSDENDWTIDSISNNGRVVVRRPKKDGIDDVLTFAPDEFASWQAIAPADPTQPDASDGGTIIKPEPADGGTVSPAEPPVRPEAAGGGVVPPTEPPVPGTPGTPTPTEAKRSAEAEQRIRGLDAVIDQYAAGAGSAALQAENKYSSEQAGRGIRGIFKGFGRRLVTKALIGGGIGAAFGGVIGAGAGVVGALGSEAGVLGMRALRYAGGKAREIMGKPDELETLQQMEAEKQNALADIARRAIEARLGDDPAEADRLRLEFIEISSQMSNPEDPRNKAMAELEQRYRGRKKWADLGWGAAETAASLAGGILSGHAALQHFATEMKARIAQAGFTMHGQGIGEITKHSAALQEIGKQGHHVASMGNGDLVYSFRPGEPAAMDEALKRAPWLWDAFAKHFHAYAPNMHLAADKMTEAGQQFAAEFNRIVGVKFAERVAGILSGIGLASLVGDAVGRRGSRRQDPTPSTLPDKKLSDVLRKDLRGGGAPPAGPDGPDGPDEPDPEKKERIPIGSVWELQSGELAEIVKNNTGRELPPNSKFKVTGQDEDGKVSLVIVDNDVEGNPVMVENADTGGESLLSWEGKYALLVDYFLANFRPAAEAVAEPEEPGKVEEEDDGYNWESIERAGEMPLMVDKEDEYEVDGKKVVLTDIQQGTPKNTEEDKDSPETESGKFKYKLTFTDEAGNSVTTEAMTTDELLDKFITLLSATDKADFIKSLFADAEKEVEEGGEDEDETAEPPSPEPKTVSEPGSELDETDGVADHVPASAEPVEEGRAEDERVAELSPKQRAQKFVEFLRDHPGGLKIKKTLRGGFRVTEWVQPPDVEVEAKKAELSIPEVSSDGFQRIPTGYEATVKFRTDGGGLGFDDGVPTIDFDVVDFNPLENPKLERAGFFFPVGGQRFDRDKFVQAVDGGGVIVRAANNKIYGIKRIADSTDVKVITLNPDDLSPDAREEPFSTSVDRVVNKSNLSDWYVNTGAVVPDAPVVRVTPEPEPAPPADAAGPVAAEPAAPPAEPAVVPTPGPEPEPVAEEAAGTEEAPIIGQSAESKNNGKTLRLRLNRDNPNEYIDLIRKDPITYRMENGKQVVLTITSAIPQADGRSVKFIFKNQKGASFPITLTLDVLNKILSDPANAALVATRKVTSGG